MTAHWGIEDPAAVEGTDIEKQTRLQPRVPLPENRIRCSGDADPPSLDKLALTARLREIGEMEGATPQGGSLVVTNHLHNPACGTSRNTLAIIRQSGEEPVVIEYLKATADARAARRADRARWAFRRARCCGRRERPYDALGLADPKWTEDELIDFMLKQPILINRPIVVTPKGARLCRPSEAVLDILPNPDIGDFTKEDGEVVTGRRRCPPLRKGLTMTTIQIFDPALCCSTGVCGVDVDQALVNFSADVDWAKQNGARIERFNLAQQPMAFAENPTVKGFLERSGQEALPLILVNGEVALAGRYPNRAELARWAGLAEAVAEATQGGCCGGSRCC